MGWECNKKSTGEKRARMKSNCTDMDMANTGNVRLERKT